MTVEEEDAFEREHDVPVNAGGSVVVATWGMGLLILFVGIAFASLLLRLLLPAAGEPGVAATGHRRPRPLAGASSPPRWWWPAAVALGRRWARLRAGDQARLHRRPGRRARAGRRRRGRPVRDIVRLDFGGTDHAYGSIFYTLAGFVFVVAPAALDHAGP